jgi:hypothetical protein
MRKMVAVIAVVCGLGLVAAPVALSLFDRAPAGERITDRFRQTMSERGLRDLSGNFQTMGALVSEFIDRTSPALAGDLHMTSAQYKAYVARSFPAVAAGVRGIPPLVAFVTPVAAQLEALHPQFAAVDSLPFLGLALGTVPWILVALGVALIGLGLVVWRARGRGVLVVAAGIGAALIIVPLVLSYPAKATAASQVAAVGKVALSTQAAAGAQTANRLIDGMVTQVDTTMIPQVADRLHLTKTAFEQVLAHDDPAVVRGLAAWPTIRPGAVALVRRQVASVHDATVLAGLRFGALPWVIVGPGIALLIGAIAGLTIGRRDEVLAEPSNAPRGTRAGGA